MIRKILRGFINQRNYYIICSWWLTTELSADSGFDNHMKEQKMFAA